ncbi:MAG: MATE family efflux transporter [Chloroflexi bacterium]|nr:MATE family efflux transporter [Chloroflexota bacterium]
MADLLWAGFLGSAQVASIGVGQTWVQFFNTARGGLDTSARAMVSRAVGADDIPQANHIVRQAVVVNTTVAVVVMGLGILLTDWLLYIIGVSEALTEEGSNYQKWRFMGFFFFSMNTLGGNLLQAGGDSLTPMKANMITRGLHLILSPVLVFGWLGVPAVGVAGTAIATGIAQAVGMTMNFRALAIGTSKLRLTLKDWSFDWPVIAQQVRIGTPAAITGAERSFAQVILVGLAGPFGQTGLAVYSITQRIQTFGGFGSQGISMAGGVLVGQNLGAREPGRAKRTVWWALAFVFGVQLVICTAMFVFPEQVLYAFSRERAVIEMGIPWLRIEAFGYMLFATGNTLGQCLNTAGETVAPMWASLGTLWGVQQPIAILLTGSALTWEIFGQSVAIPSFWNVGVLGIPIAIVTASFVRLAILFGYFQWGPWWKKEVLVRSRDGGRVAAAH